MFQIVYISTARDVSHLEVDRILSKSRSNNQRDGITGLLLYNGRRFLQALEGPTSSVERAIERIRIDPRHRAAVLLSSKIVDAPQFGNWDMACERVGQGGGQQLIQSVDNLVAKLSDASLKAEFTSYARLKVA